MFLILKKVALFSFFFVSHLAAYVCANFLLYISQYTTIPVPQLLGLLFCFFFFKICLFNNRTRSVFITYFFFSAFQILQPLVNGGQYILTPVGDSNVLVIWSQIVSLKSH